MIIFVFDLYHQIKKSL